MSNPRFRDMSPMARIEHVASRTGLSAEGRAALIKGMRLADDSGLRSPPAENHLTYAAVPIGVVPHIVVNGRDRVVPMMTEEPSVIAASSNAAKMADSGGGFVSRSTGTITRGQIQIVGIPEGDGRAIEERILQNRGVLMALANEQTPHLVAAGGGIVSLTPVIYDTRAGRQLIVNFRAECLDAMGANAVSKMAEGMAPRIAELAGGRAVGRILSNHAPERAVVCEATFDPSVLTLKKEIKGAAVEIPGPSMVNNIVALSAWADVEQDRAATHNKGIMNGITAVSLALGQDTRALESAVHSFAAQSGAYRPLSTFEKDADGNLVGRLIVPIPIGVLGGAIDSNEMVKALIELMDCKDSKEVAEVIAAVGLAQNLSALRMLGGEGITSGHLPLHEQKKELGDSLRP